MSRDSLTPPFVWLRWIQPDRNTATALQQSLWPGSCSMLIFFHHIQNMLADNAPPLPWIKILGYYFFKTPFCIDCLFIFILRKWLWIVTMFSYSKVFLHFWIIHEELCVCLNRHLAGNEFKSVAAASAFTRLTARFRRKWNALYLTLQITGWPMLRKAASLRGATNLHLEGQLILPSFLLCKCKRLNDREN